MIDLAAKALLKLAADCRDSEGVTLPKERALKIATAIDNVLVRLETAEATPASSPAGGDVVRCLATGNPVGTDTWQVGRPCRCANCLPLSQSTSAGRVGE